MDELDVADDYNLPSTSTNNHSGITLVLPSLLALKAANAGKKTKSGKQVDLGEQRQKAPRPVKLKPLKEVLTKLITQIKKKDDYAFFLRPVDPAQVPGYTDVIMHPMDFGTMTNKVIKSKYRSLDEFTTDFQLVTANAKTFNPPGSIYYTEADRLETWGLEHITRASAHVIEYETDWNIDIERDEDGSSQHVNVEEEVSTPRDLDGSMAAGSPAPSMTPAPGQVPSQGQGKRGPRGPYKKHAQTTAMSEGLDTEGRMPGAKDGVGAFPPGSDWAELMVALKIKGKRYKTKKERLRFEKEGPPYQPDGSLDYAEMEDPFSILNVLVPEPPSRPQVTPLYPPPSTTTLPPSTSSTNNDQAQAESRTSQPPVHAPMPITIPSNRLSPVLSTLCNNTPRIPIPPIASTSASALTLQPPKKRRHWSIVRNVSTRARAKDKDSDATTNDAKTSWKTPRDAGPADYGTFAMFLWDLVESAVGANAGSGAVGGTTGALECIYGSEPRLYATIRSTVEHRGVKRKREVDSDEARDSKVKVENEGDEKTYWTDERAEEAWDYLRNIVYGGVDGYAYVRSLAEFVAPSVYLNEVHNAEGADPEQDADIKKHMLLDLENHDAPMPLGVPVARYVEDNLVDVVTRGRHGWLRDVLFPPSACPFTIYPSPLASNSLWAASDGDTSPFQVRLGMLPGAARAMAMFKAWSGEPLDMATLIRAPEELAMESALEGVGEGVGEGTDQGGGRERVEIERALAWSVDAIEELGRKVSRGEIKGDGGWDGKVRVKEEVKEVMMREEEEEESEEEEEEEEDTIAAANANAMEVDAKPERAEIKGDDGSPTRSDLKADMEEEDPMIRRLRMNLLALAKRAPLDRIAKLPVELVPESIRGIVPLAS